MYRDRENSEVIAKSKPKGIGKEETVRKLKAIRGIIKYRRRTMRRIERLCRKNPNIMGVYVLEKGVRGLRRKSKKKKRGIGRIRTNSEDTRIEYQEMQIIGERGVRTMRIWIGMEPLPKLIIQDNNKREGKRTTNMGVPCDSLRLSHGSRWGRRGSRATRREGPHTGVLAQSVRGDRPRGRWSYAEGRGEEGRENESGKRNNK